MNLVLIGYRATGKSQVAHLLAERTGWPWLDADDQIEALAGKSIAQIFSQDGEQAFRAWEARVVADLAQRQQTVLALGGGAMILSENREAVARQGRIVWLTASPETIWQRIRTDAATAGRRPNLTPAGGIDEIIATLRQREPTYRQCAHLEIDTEHKTPEEVADAILAEWKFSESLN